MTATAQETARRDDLFATFRRPDPAYSPCPLWWWSGDALDADRLKWQLERYREGGVWNLVVINLAPAGPLYGHFADEPPFMSEAWWAMFRTVCDHARTLGMRIWFYDQIGFSGANIQGQLIARNEDYAGRTIERATHDGPGPATIACPPDGTPLAASVRKLDRDGQPVGLPEAIPIVDGGATWTGPVPVRLSLAYTARRGFDYFSAEACARLLDTIHGEFERRMGDWFGDVIVGSFQDELPAMPRWSETFAAEFERLHGYDPLPWLDGLWDGLDGRERRLRHDYHATRAALAERAFFQPLHAWHTERGLTVGVDQQNPARAGDPEGTVRQYADYLKTHRWFNAPGSDHHGEAKIHSSLAHIYGHRRVWIESFHSSGWGGTLEETFDWLVPWLRAGANLYNPHATYYSTHGGWSEWAPPSTDWRQPYWAHYRTFADAIARLCWLLSSGAHACDVGVHFPTATVQGGLGLDGTISKEARAAHEAYEALVGRMVWFNQQTGLLDAAGEDYDILDDDSIVGASCDDGRLRIADESYRTVILPACTDLEPATTAALLRFAESGGEILALGSAPTRLTAGDPGASTGISDLIGQLTAHVTVVNGDGLQARLEASPRLVEAPVPTLVRRVDGRTVVFVPAAFPGASHISGWPVATINFDRTAYAPEMTITVRDVEGVPEIWDPFQGTRTSITPDRCRAVPGGVEVDVPFDLAPCAILVWGSSADGEPASAPAEMQVIAELHGDWDVVPQPTLDNRWGDFNLPASAAPFPIQRWTFAQPDATGEEAPIVATYGPRARWLGPSSADLLAAADDQAPWKTASWSLSRGIQKDPIHPRHLGPAGQVPEEFMEFGTVAAGESVRVRFGFDLDGDAAFTGWFVIGAAATKGLRIDGDEVAIDPAENLRYESAVPVTLGPGRHLVDLVLTSRHDGLVLRAWFALVADLENCRRPDRLTVGGEPVPETTVGFRTSFTIDRPVRSGLIQVGTRGPARILLDGQEVGRQGGYLPYGDGSATHRYDIADLLAEGVHELAIHIEDTAVPVSLVVDGVIAFEDATDDLWIMTSPEWTATREDRPVPLAIETRPAGDPALAHLRQRPHPLPAAAWLNGAGADTGAVTPIVPFADVGGTTTHLRCVVPPGAMRATIPVMGRASAILDGKDVSETDGPPGLSWTVALPNPEGIGRVLDLRIETAPGHAGGAALAGPVSFDVGPGRLPLGDWGELGLADYSGMVCYAWEIEAAGLPAEGALYLDLGDVRGSVEVRVNGESMGIRVVAPYRVEITRGVRAATGTVSIEIVVANTLAPYLDAASPTPFVGRGQTVSGLFGPIRILLVPDASERETAN